MPRLLRSRIALTVVACLLTSSPVVGAHGSAAPAELIGRDRVGSLPQAQVAAIKSLATNAATISGPIASGPVGAPDRNYPFGAATRDLARIGYREDEFFMSGTTVGGDYRTRLLVRRPIKSDRFSGTVIVEWQNVTNGFGLDCLWARSSQQITRDGDAYVTVDAQTAGLDTADTGLRAWSPERYSTLHIPQSGTFVAEVGAYPIFAQAMTAIRGPEGSAVPPLGDLAVEKVIATGCSQSAGALLIYADTLGALPGIVDGYLSVMLSSATIGPQQHGLAFPYIPNLPDGVPLLQLNTQSDPSTHRLPDSSTYRLWEVAGTSHQDIDLQNHIDQVTRRDFGTITHPACQRPPWSRIPFRYTQNAALVALKKWLARAVPPETQPSFEYAADGSLVLDDLGNVRGGVRLPQAAVATATSSGVNAGEGLCSLLGSSEPFDDATLNELYPTHAAYVHAFKRATAQAVASDVLLSRDARASIRAARRSGIGRN